MSSTVDPLTSPYSFTEYDYPLVRVEFTVDENGFVKVTVYDVETGSPTASQHDKWVHAQYSFASYERGARMLGEFDTRDL